jgi:hypothetical protein
LCDVLEWRKENSSGRILYVAPKVDALSCEVRRRTYNIASFPCTKNYVFPQNIEFFEEAQFRDYLQKFPYITNFWMILNRLSELGWKTHYEGPIESFSFGRVDEKSLKFGITKFHSRKALCQYISKFPHLLLPVHDLVTVAQDFGWSCKDDRGKHLTKSTSENSIQFLKNGVSNEK